MLGSQGEWEWCFGQVTRDMHDTMFSLLLHPKNHAPGVVEGHCLQEALYGHDWDASELDEFYRRQTACQLCPATRAERESQNEGGGIDPSRCPSGWVAGPPIPPFSGN